MSKANKKKAKQLGMPHGTASNRLRKMIMFDLLKRLDMDICSKCGDQIDDIRELSIEHVVPWLDSKNPVNLFFDLNNIAFSHMLCNYGGRRHKVSAHGSVRRYRVHGCRCMSCTKANTIEVRKVRSRIK